MTYKLTLDASQARLISQNIAASHINLSGPPRSNIVWVKLIIEMSQVLRLYVS